MCVCVCRRDSFVYDGEGFWRISKLTARSGGTEKIRMVVKLMTSVEVIHWHSNNFGH